MPVNQHNSNYPNTSILTPLSLIRIGLGLVFLANALVAILQPEEFTELLETSFIGGLIPLAAVTITKIIAINDTIVSLLLITGYSGRWLFMWAAVWIAGALAIIGKPLEMLEETGLLAMALALTVSERK